MECMWAVCDGEANGKYHAYPIRIAVADNLLSKLIIKGIQASHLCEHKKTAKQFAHIRTVCHKTNNEYMFPTGDPTF